MKNKLLILIMFASIMISAQTQQFRFGGNFIGDVTFNNKVFAPVGISNNEVATVGQLNLKANDSDVVKLSGNQTVAGTKTFTGSNIHSGINSFTSVITVPTALSTIEAVNLGQMNDAIALKATVCHTITSDVVWTGNASFIISVDTPITSTEWTNAYGWEIWWNDGVGATAYKRSLDHYAGKNVQINSGNRTSDDRFSLSLDVSGTFTIPAGAKICTKQ